MNPAGDDLMAVRSVGLFETLPRAPIDERGTGATTRRRILVVEDDYFVSLQTEDALKEGGYEVVGTVRTAREAIEWAQRLLPDLVLMDIRLAEGSDGISAAVEIMRRYRIHSIFATAHSDDGTKSRAAEALPAGWLTKPFSNAALLQAVEAAFTKERG
jgi:CheY-like chemotaxis protein